MKGMQTNIGTYEQYYAKPSWWFRWRYDTQVKRKTCLALIKTLSADWAGKKICEIGFGSGDLLFSFPKDCELYGVESSSSALKTALALAEKKGYRKYQFFSVQDPFKILLDDVFIDLVIASHVLEHVENELDCLHESWRILKPGGAFAVLVPINERYNDPNHLRRYTAMDCREICEGEGFHFVHGFENERLFHFVEPMYQRHYEKPWTLGANIGRVIFNLAAAPLPFFIYRALDFVLMKLTGLPPRQAALLFIK